MIFWENSTLYGYLISEKFQPVRLFGPIRLLGTLEYCFNKDYLFRRQWNKRRIFIFFLPYILYFSIPGEILMKGRNVMMGYLNSDEKTKEAITESGMSIKFRQIKVAFWIFVF